ncbi:ABC transporter substrate-binding protein, partial [Oceanispirochaeta sp.]|uniref:ABC transporter substrate-binding protein n=1 Tax=Oceanispirochaeta sp. TaxID=2035350 RepID=UPI00262B2134
EKSKEMSDEKVTLTVWDFKYSEEVMGSALKDMDSLYMTANPGVEINHVAQPHDNYYEILASSLSSGIGPDVLMAHTDQRIWNMEEFLLPLDSYIASWKDDIADSAWAACSSTKESDKNIKIIPLTAQGLGIYYNKANLKKAGIDPNADLSDASAFMDACKKLKAAGIPAIVMGNGGAPYGVDFTYRTLLANFYGPELTGFSNGKANFTDEAFIEATRMLKTMFTMGYVITENATMPYFMDAIEVFKSGEGGFFVGLTSDIAHWKDFGDAFGYENLGYMPSINSPKAKYKNRQSNQGAGIGFAVLKTSEHKEIAVDFLYEYIHGESANIFLNRTGAIIPNKNLPIENETLATVVNFMSKNAVPDFYVQLDAGFGAEFYNYIQLFFLADEMTLNEYIESLQKAYELSF